jgi:small nuclear ribonucleoprotein (snRNP)-like protein
MQAFDEHLNMVLGDVEEKHITQITDAAGASSFKVRKRHG